MSIAEILWFLVALVILVTAHEFGHFYVARLCGVKVLRFSVGFGTPLFKWKDKLGTEFALSAIPLGGYVKMLDEREGEVPEEELHQAFTQKSPWQRIAVAAAGPVMNFILAFLFFALLFYAYGTTDRVPYVGEITPGSIAEEAGLEYGQEIVAIDGQPTPTQRDVLYHLLGRLGESGEISFSVKYPDSDLTYVSDAQLDDWLREEVDPDPFVGIGLQFQTPPVVVGSLTEGGAAHRAGLELHDLIVAADDQEILQWGDFVDYIRSHPNQEIELLVDREGREIIVPVTPEMIMNEQEGREVPMIGMGPHVPESFFRQYNYSFLGAISAGLVETKDRIVMVFVMTKKLVMGELSAKNLSSVISIAKVAGSTAASGWVYFLQFLAWLSVVLGVMNLLPIPVLDGGHIMFYLAEVIKGSPLSERVQLIGYQVGLVMVVGLMVFALYQDFLRHFASS